MFVRIFSSRRVPIYCVNLVLVSSNDPFVMLGPLSVFFVILVTVFTRYFRAIKMMNIKRIVYSSIERLQRKRQLHVDLTSSRLLEFVNKLWICDYKTYYTQCWTHRYSANCSAVPLSGPEHQRTIFTSCSYCKTLKHAFWWTLESLTT